MVRSLIAAAAAAFVCVAHAGPITIEHIRLGMTQQEFARVLPQGLPGGLVIGGASSRQGFAPATAEFRGGRLVQLSAYFAPEDFDRIRQALVAKNPSVRCRDEQQVSVCYAPEDGFVLTRSGASTALLLQTPRMAAEAQRAVSELEPVGDVRAGL